MGPQGRAPGNLMSGSPGMATDEKRRTPALGLAAGITTAAVAATFLASGRHLRLGATPEEMSATLPGDDLIRDATRSATRAITIHAPAAEVWPWVAQMGQEKAGFYTYATLENLVGCRITNADRIVEAWQRPQAGDPFKLHPDLALLTAQVLPGEALVVRNPERRAGVEAPMPFDFSWAFVLRPDRTGTHCRLVVRERYRPDDARAVRMLRMSGPVAALMTFGMLRGIRRRAETPALPA